RWCREAIERMRHQVRFRAVRQLEFDGHSTWTGKSIRIWDSRNSGEIGKTDSNWNSGRLKMGRFRQGGGIGAGGERAGEDHPFRMHCTIGCLFAKNAVQRVNHLVRSSFLVGECRRARKRNR